MKGIVRQRLKLSLRSIGLTHSFKRIKMGWEMQLRILNHKGFLVIRGGKQSLTRTI